MARKKEKKSTSAKVTEDRAMEEVQDQVKEEQPNTEEKAENNEENQEESSSTEASGSKKESTPEEKYNELNNKYLRLYSDFENFRRRSAKERLELIDQAGADIIKDLLVILDDFDRAIENNEKIDDINAVKEGFSLIQQKLFKTLESKGLKCMDSKEKAFDTEYHEAITNIPAPSEDLKGKNVDVIEKGYFLRDKVLRFAKVVVGQ